ncbi:MAG: sugar phosphate nucleotidyltransferase [Candidatus Binatia bacterium]
MKYTSTSRKLWGIVLAGGEGTRVRTLLQHLCGGRGIKQFCAVIGRRSMLEHTLARVERMIPRERIVVVLSADHRPEAAPQLAHWPVDNVIYQPANRDTAPGILLPLAHVSHRDPLATVALFPSDHFILDEERFMASVQQAVAETQDFPHELTLLGMTPDGVEEGYGWIEPAGEERGRATQAVRRFWEKPSLSCAQELLARGALWNTFVCVAQAATV